MGLKIATCPYCDSECFESEAIRADKPNLPENMADLGAIVAAMDAFDNVYGYWFNKCMECKAWSVHKHGKNLKIAKKNIKPKQHSLSRFKG